MDTALKLTLPSGKVIDWDQHDSPEYQKAMQDHNVKASINPSLPKPRPTDPPQTDTALGERG